MDIQIKDNLTIRELISYALCALSFIAGIVLIFASLLIDPRGVIDHSVIYSFGLLLTFCGSLLGISMHYECELNNFKNKILNEK